MCFNQNFIESKILKKLSNKKSNMKDIKLSKLLREIIIFLLNLQNILQIVLQFGGLKYSKVT